jgi:hypothetical protein
MKYLVVKVKDKDLFFNADEGMGEYVCSIPMLFHKEMEDTIMIQLRKCQFYDEIYHLDNMDEVYTNDQLEIKEVELKVL